MFTSNSVPAAGAMLSASHGVGVLATGVMVRVVESLSAATGIAPA